MEGEPSLDALRRIDAALARIEQAAARPLPAASATSESTATDLQDLQARHAALQDTGRAVLNELDNLIDGLAG